MKLRVKYGQDARWFSRECWYVLGPRALVMTSWILIAGLGRLEVSVGRVS